MESQSHIESCDRNQTTADVITGDDVSRKTEILDDFLDLPERLMMITGREMILQVLLITGVLCFTSYTGKLIKLLYHACLQHTWEIYYMYAEICLYVM